MRFATEATFGCSVLKSELAFALLFSPEEATSIPHNSPPYLSLHLELSIPIGYYFSVTSLPFPLGSQAFKSGIFKHDWYNGSLINFILSANE